MLIYLQLYEMPAMDWNYIDFQTYGVSKHWNGVNRRHICGNCVVFNNNTRRINLKHDEIIWKIEVIKENLTRHMKVEYKKKQLQS